MLYKQIARERRKKRIRKKIEGTGERPRLTVFRSNRHIYAQLIDDYKKCTLVSASTMEKEMRSGAEGSANIKVAKEVGMKLAERARAKSYQKVVFDRSGYLFHGRIKAVAEGAKEGGLQF